MQKYRETLKAGTQYNDLEGTISIDEDVNSHNKTAMLRDIPEGHQRVGLRLEKPSGGNILVQVLYTKSINISSTGVIDKDAEIFVKTVQMDIRDFICSIERMSAIILDSGLELIKEEEFTFLYED